MKEEYYFYDGEGNTGEDHNLLDNNMTDDYNRKSRSNILPLIVAGLTTLLFLAAAVISWVLFHKHRSPIVIAHAIICTIGFLFGLFSLFWAFQNKNRKSTPLLSFICFIGSIVLGGYCLASTIFIWAFVPFHYEYMNSTYLRPQDWSFHFWDYAKDFAKKEDWRLIFVLTILSILLIITLAILAHSAWYSLDNWYELKKWALCVSLICITVFGFLCIIWYLDYRLVFEVLRKSLFSKSINLPFIIYIISIGVVSFTLINSVISLLKSRIIHFIFGVLWVILCFSLLIFTAFIFRDVLRYMESPSVDPILASRLAHENLYSDFCVEKYLPSGRAGGLGVVYRYEEEPLKPRSLNKDCKVTTNAVTIWPYYIMGIFLSFLTVSCGGAAGANLAIGVRGKYDYSYKNFAIYDYIALIVIVLTGLALILYIIFRPIPEEISRFTSENSEFNIINGELVHNMNFKGKL